MVAEQSLDRSEHILVVREHALVGNTDMQELYFESRVLWRTWLTENHDTVEEGIWLVYYKKDTGTPSMAYEASVEEAL